MDVLVAGAGGMLGTDVVERLGREHTVVGADRAELDVTDAAAVELAVRDFGVVVNCAAWTAVDDAESDEAGAFGLNARAPHLLAQAASASGARLIHVSTDYVFAGDASEPYGENSALGPVSAYGRTKAAGEWAVLAAGRDHVVVRTAWLYGAHGGCFPKTIARAAGQRSELSVVADQVGQPTWTADVADLIARLLDAGAPGGVYHATSSGQCSWYEFARDVVAAAGRDPGMVRPTTSDAFVRPAHRPAYSVLGHERLASIGVAPIGDWRERWELAAPAVLAGVEGGAE